MAAFPDEMQKLIREFAKLPTIGEKSAIRLAYHLLANDRKLALSLAGAITGALDKVKLCEKCFFLSDDKFCAVCKNCARDESLVCVVEKPVDVVAIEKLGEYKGYYHVLHGVWAPLRGLGPDKIRLAELVERVKGGGVKEVILATSSTVEGDATAFYVARLMNELSVITTRLAQGMPKGGELEYSDEITLSRAFAGRSAISL